MKNKLTKQPLSERLVKPFEKFAEIEASSGILLFFCTIVALIWANSPWAESYTNLWQTKFTIGFGDFALSKPLLLWINDGLMAVFFFAVGLEIKREILIGELASFKKAILPIVAALGGMVVPAGIYLLFNHNTQGASGWGIPMATDIAFALGVLALLGRRVPVSLKIFLMALAIIDDIGAVLVIAIFYTSHISWMNLMIGAGFLVLLFAANRTGVRRPLVYAVLGIGGLWLAFLLSGVHATVAGVLSAFMIPARTRIHSKEFIQKGKNLIDEFETYSQNAKEVLTNQDQQSILHDLERSCELTQTPLQRLEHSLHPWVMYVIMPIFALANAGVSLQAGLSEVLFHPITLGIVFGLFLGKPIGIFFFSWIAIKLKWAMLPREVSFKQLAGVGVLGGIGFTMSLFIASLAFGGSFFLPISKVGILLASTLAGIAGWTFLKASSCSKEES